jgi:hypothetical protein
VGVSEGWSLGRTWESIVSDTTNNPISANNFIQAGYRLYEPELPWAWSHTLYWRKWLR